GDPDPRGAAPRERGRQRRRGRRRARPGRRRRHRGVVRRVIALYAATIFLSAALLFTVQPMFTRLVLPLLGGSPGAWNTALVFFQGTLLAGYGYAHLTTRWLGIRRQAFAHVAAMLLPVLALPLALPRASAPPAGASPVPWLLSTM